MNFRSLSRPIQFFLLTMILANIAGEMHFVLLPLYLQELGANVEQIGLFFTLSAIAPLLFQIFGGWLSDSIGRLQSIAIGSIAGLVSYVFFVLAPTWQWLLVSMVLSAATRALVWPSFQAFIAEQTTEDNRGQVYGVVQSIYAIVGVVGPPLGGFLTQSTSFRSMYMVAGTFYGVAAVGRIGMAIWAMRREPEKAGSLSWQGLKSSLWQMGALLVAGGLATWIFVTDGIQDIASNMSSQFIPVYVNQSAGVDKFQLGILSAISALVVIATAGRLGQLSDRISERFALVLGSVFFIANIAIFLTTRNFVILCGGWVCLGLSQALIEPAKASLISKAIPQKLRGVAFGILGTSTGLIALPAPWIGGQLWERIAPQAPFVVLICALLITLPIMWFKFNQMETVQEASSA
jgi:MFS family permease